MSSTLLTEPPLNPVHAPFSVDRILHPTGPEPRRKHKIIAVLPAYNAASTLAATIADFPPDSVDEILLVDDCSKDDTVRIARDMGLTVIQHEKNTGYGGNQKTCYRYCLERGADIVVMIHPDYQYDARVIPHAVGVIELGICDVVLGNRVRSRSETLKCGMPWWKYLSNRGLTAFENLSLGQNLGEFHSGFRVYRRQVLETIPFEGNSDDFVFDTQFLVQAVHFGFRLGDVPVPVRYFDEASQINFRRSTKYGLQTLTTVGAYWLNRLGVRKFPLFKSK
ncbi:glycosyltransferase family 2 protein [Urbifossiella limnaea]|uniref:Undecaprenyl-phosphate mannosyltransferase n=1 Tax=Urbifossiella limnaea TaxID=2528023 RepID=A0A517XQY6_9BACT|nr:glycosyltransferase family 2 protein [Urbifossiella limnaea]QDU19917.1 Undecaprenyl-phosphate mannosyltransferase [Urbifossiella limnaea]